MFMNGWLEPPLTQLVKVKLRISALGYLQKLFSTASLAQKLDALGEADNKPANDFKSLVYLVKPFRKSILAHLSMTHNDRHLWGEDSQLWNPVRWLKNGVINNSIKY